MTASTKQGRQMEAVYRALGEHIAGQEALPSTSDVFEAVDLSEHHVRKALDLLEKNGTIRRAYHGPGDPTVWVPTRMWEALLHYKERPEWMDEHGLEKRENLESKIRDEEDELNRLRRIEELLYANSGALEEAIATALGVLEVEELSADFDDPDSWDFSFRLGDALYISEAKGKGGAADKDDVQQLEGWLTQYLDENPDADPDELRGLLIVNHYKDVEPEDRWPANPDRAPLTTHGEKQLRLQGRRFLTTIDLFGIVAKVVSDEATPAEARDELESRMRRKVSNDG